MLLTLKMTHLYFKFGRYSLHVTGRYTLFCTCDYANSLYVIQHPLARITKDVV